MFLFGLIDVELLVFDVFSDAINEAYEDYPLSYSRSVDVRR